ncbi:ATP-binding response regulator [Halorussus marinus]|uniref:ATP-binding response regulator n=1 Tax=Halorussus marinus TaxID=2505976 RepID=UPI00106E9C4B|nr:hybrid sensor histidine kinase/response regulator [Halorussus marinus]
MVDAPPRVLHVEDNDFFARITADVLGDYDIDVCTVGSADAALDKLAAEKFDCVVSDYEMPGMDGLELLDEVHESYPDLPFILLTGGGSEQIASRAISAGVTDYLKKATGKEQFTVLANRIENAISRRRTERRVDRQIEVNDRIWDVSQAVLRASSREEIEEIVCEQLAGTEPYSVAWVGKTDANANVIHPQVATGIDVAALEPIALAADRDDAPSEPRSTDGAASVSNPRLIREAIATETVQVATRPVPDADDRGGADRNGSEDADGESAVVAVVPLVYESTIYGTLSLWSVTRGAFGKTERRVLSKFGSSVAYAIDSVRTRKELVRREQRLQVFNRILRHNLRNDLNVVLGHAENLLEENPGSEADVDVIKRKVIELIEISEKAREVGKTLDREDETRTQIDLAESIEHTVEEFRQSYPETEILVDCPDSVYAYADKTIDAAISEVLENAIEHTDCESPSVTVCVSRPVDESGWVELAVLDDGPGIPEEEQEVLSEGKETALHHGSGLGLWLANWIVEKFGGELAFDDDRTDGSAVILRLQHASVAGDRTPEF